MSEETCSQDHQSNSQISTQQNKESPKSGLVRTKWCFFIRLQHHRAKPELTGIGVYCFSHALRNRQDPSSPGVHEMSLVAGWIVAASIQI
jgi:hypothetical protein